MKSRGDGGHQSREQQHTTSKGEGDQALIILKEMLHESSKEGVLESIAALQKKNVAVQNFLNVGIGSNRMQETGSESTLLTLMRRLSQEFSGSLSRMPKNNLIISLSLGAIPNSGPNRTKQRRIFI